ncbi:M15 family metallopeptidase [Plantactinospora sp. WMMB334]|uniref:M15 family metallopeptidase n=1 Tax=Plantactinospora sp. WMMB334 TaxID=3404119 RepID=UPI003B944574
MKRRSRGSPLIGLLAALAVAALAVLGGAAGCAARSADPAGSPEAPTAPAGGSGTPTASAGPGGGAGDDRSSTVPGFVTEVSTVTADDLGASWRPGCPVGPDQLRRIRLGYWDFDGRPQVGTIIVHRSVTPEVVGIFATLYRERFPIRRLRPVDAYGGSDDRSMADDNTSGFNCRKAVSTGRATWSSHAYGKAIDVNPVENPYLLDGRVLPPAGAAYRDRSGYRPGMAVRGGTLVEAFAAAGWQWGGGWDSPDYQHFTRTGG